MRFLMFPVLFLMSCSEQFQLDKSICRGCSSEYPYYTQEHLNSPLIAIDNLPVLKAELSKLTELKKIIVFPVESRRYTVVGFANEFLRSLEEKGWDILDSDTQNIPEQIRLRDPDIVVFYMTDMSESSNRRSHNLQKEWPSFSVLRFLKIFISEDLTFEHNRDAARFFAKHSDAVLARYPEAFYRVTQLSENLYPFYHCAGPQYVEASTDFNQKKAKALLSGGITKSWYPLRVRALELFEQKNEYLSRRVHPGYKNKMDPAQEAKDYALEISSHRIAISGAGLGNLPAPYILAKHFEIPATGTVLVTDKIVAPLMERLGFIENVHYLASTPETLESDLKRWLAQENTAVLEKIGHAGRELVLERHTLKKRVEEFEKVVYYAWSKNN